MNQILRFNFASNELHIDGVFSPVAFPWPIAQVVSCGTMLIVRIEPEPGTCFNENVFGVRPDGSIAWTIAPRKHVYNDSPYTSLALRDGGVMLYNWDGDELLVEAQTGQTISQGYGK